MGFLESALSALPDAASTPLALVGYVVLIVAWVVIALRVKRNKQLLGSLEKLPEGDRLKVLQMEMGAVHIKSGLTPEQWIRSRVHLYYFLGFAILSLVVVLIFTIAATTGATPGTAEGTITLYQDEFDDPTSPTQASVSQDLPVTVRNEYDGSGGNTPQASADLTLTYRYDRRGDSIYITPQMPFLSRLERGGPIKGINFWWSVFQWQFPRLSVKFVNNTPHTVFLTEIVVKVNSSVINTEPVLIIEEDFCNVGKFDIINEGWGKVIDPTVEFGITNVGAYDSNSPLEGRKESIRIDTFFERATVEVGGYVPANLRGANLVTAFGTIHYTTEDGDQRAVKFKTRVSLVAPGPGAPAPPTYTYDVFLEAGKSGYTELVPISQTVEANSVDHFLLRVATDKSARFDLDFSFRVAGGEELAGESVSMDIFVPRTQQRRIARR
ncbi:MAG: hypothetical protein CMJ84_14575 [Planctomycetes bacterium]|nr:hypothetical protein [Planctomycetota bacterium]